ncbi:MAG: rhamnose utilization protein RhaD (predicted bifunctional aldolase and dehydrogenase) [Flavobacteriaceae bacterium]|jgi:rhamnose utilization protein RhaD (predicted bifunctional aldolase and dehydrogenase)
MIPEKFIKESVVNYCDVIGVNPLLVQGAGGNVSWKDGGTLWIKASGAWLSDATQNDIFVPVDLVHLQKSVLSGNFSVLPKLRAESNLRPSIETLLHALMPHPVVIHLHAIEVLAHLVRHGVELTLSSVLGTKVRWTNVGYFKPGEELASAVWTALLTTPDADVVFLQSHGIVIGGEDIDAVNGILRTLTDAFKTVQRPILSMPQPASDIYLDDGKSYVPVRDLSVHQLAIDMVLFNRLASDWALYPDHVVFLGPKARMFECIGDFKKTCQKAINCPELAFVRGVGVFVLPDFSIGKYSQLCCYYDVLSRQVEGTMLSSLGEDQIADLLDWDAEKYRMHVAK